MNIAQHKGQPWDQPAGPVTISTPRAAVRKSPSPLPARDVQDRTLERSWSPAKRSRPTTRTDRYSFEGSDSSSCSRSSHFRAAIQVYETKKHFQWRRWGKFQECLLHNMHSSDRWSHHLKRPSRSCQRGKSEEQGHLLDLGEEEKTDKVSGMDQPSLLNTMASTARIAQGLKDYEEVDKTPGMRGPSDSRRNWQLSKKQK